MRITLTKRTYYREPTITVRVKNYKPVEAKKATPPPREEKVTYNNREMTYKKY